MKMYKFQDKSTFKKSPIIHSEESDQVYKIHDDNEVVRDIKPANLIFSSEANCKNGTQRLASFDDFDNDPNDNKHYSDNHLGNLPQFTPNFDIPCKFYKFKINYSELKSMIDQSVLDPHRPYRHLTGHFMKLFENNVSLIEKTQVAIQKRNNIVHDETCRTNTVYLRINGDCKFCPRGARVKYVFTIKEKPKGNENLIEVDGKCIGIHLHNFNKNKQPILNHNSNETLNESFENSTSPVTSGTISSDDSQSPKYLFKNNCNNSHSLNRHSFSAANKLVSLAKKRKYSDTEIIGNPTANESFNNSTEQDNCVDKNFISQIVTKMSNKILFKLDQINTKVNQINDRLYSLEKKVDKMEFS